MAEAVFYVAACLFAFALVQRRLATTPITGPILFVALGLLASAGGLGIITESSLDVGVVVDVVFNATLALLLFSDAASLHPSSWRKNAGLPGRLLGIGLPITIALGAVIAAFLFTDLGFWEAAIIGAIIAPTDAALGQAVVSNPRVPARIRQALDVESGLNDGVSLPFVLIFIDLAREEPVNAIGTFLTGIGIAAGVGLGVGIVGGWLLSHAVRAGLAGRTWSSIAVIALAAIAFVAADQGGGSGFISAFVAGLSYGEVTRRRTQEEETDLAADLGDALVQVSFLLFGALVLEPAFGDATWQIVVMAVLALTIVRIGPVALSMIGAGLRPPTIGYLGWFGPRGLATIVFAVLVVEEADLAGIDTITTVAAVTVGMSVLVHGLTAYPGSQRYGDWCAAATDSTAAENRPIDRHRLRHRFRRSRQGFTEPGPQPADRQPSARGADDPE